MKENLTAKEAMMLNRKARRKLGKFNKGVRIPGMTRPFVRKEWEKENFRDKIDE